MFTCLVKLEILHADVYFLSSPKTPLRKLVVMGLDKVKRGRGPVVSTTVAATLFVVFVSSLYSIMKVKKRCLESGAVNPTDQVLLANHILEASLMGICLFLGMMIDRLHYYVKEMWLLRKSLEATQKHIDASHPITYKK